MDEDLRLRIQVVSDWVGLIKGLTRLEDGNWNSMFADLRLLATNYILRRQLESLDAALLLAQNDFGHLAVGLVRPALDELLWLSWVMDLPTKTAQSLLLALGRSDTSRSLIAQRSYVGDDAMSDLWYPVAFLDSVASGLKEIDQNIVEVREELGWAGGKAPSAKWVAEQCGELELYEYLHSATSRALHFSMGEVMRNAWGKPGGILTTLKPEFRSYRAAFALSELPRLFMQTTAVTSRIFDGCGVTSDPDVDGAAVIAAVERFMALGRIPLVHAHEWNLTPPEPLTFRDPTP